MVIKKYCKNTVVIVMITIAILMIVMVLDRAASRAMPLISSKLPRIRRWMLCPSWSKDSEEESLRCPTLEWWFGV